MNGSNTTTIIGIAVVLVLVLGLIAAFASNKEQEGLLSITSFEECAAAGYPVMESYPEQCRTLDGRTFINERAAIPEPPMQTVGEGCAIAGCSGQLCVAADEASEIVTTCEFRAEYACYQNASCERQADDSCGWTETPELTACLANPPGPDGELIEVY